MNPRTRAVLAVLCSLALTRSGVGQTPPVCAPEWIPTFGGNPNACWAGSTVEALAAFDDGHGTALFAAGQDVLGSAHGFVSKWDGWGWTDIAQPFVGTELRALAVYDDGSGPALFVAGNFSSIGGVAANDIARWDGTSWSPLGSGTVGPGIRALEVHDDGSGPQLFVGGNFVVAGGIVAQNLARWNGTSWSAMATGMNGPITALRAHDDGSGRALFAGGAFTSAGGLACAHIAKWDGTSWSQVAAGLSGNMSLIQTVQALTVFDDGSGAALYAGGAFTLAGGSPANHVARWDGTNWSPLASGTSGSVSVLAEFDNGTGPALYAGGSFASASGVTVNSIARWDGMGWWALGSGVEPGAGQVHALATFDAGTGPKLEVGGQFASAGGTLARNLASWDSSGWSLPGIGLDGIVTAMANYDDGTGMALYVGGSFRMAGGVATRCMAKWDGAHWSAMPNTPPNFFWDVRCMAVFDDGSGSALYVGDSGNAPLARWDGTSWSTLGPSIVGFETLLVFDDGSGPTLYGTAGLGNRVYKWTGQNWAILGGAADSVVFALAGFDDGSGPALYAGGDFSLIGGQSAARVARWNGSVWQPLGSGITGPYPTVYALQVHDDGVGGPSLFAGGQFDTAGGLPAANIARWNGGSWSALGSGLTNSGPGGPCVFTLASFDAGSGSKLYAGGRFDQAGGVPSLGLARWDGAGWNDVGLGVAAHAPSANTLGKLAVARVDSTSGSALLASGGFFGSNGGDAFLARLDLPLGCLPLGTPFCSPGAGGVIGCPCSNPPAGTRVGCDNSFATGGAQLVATGVASLANDLVQFTTSGETPSATSIVLQGTSQSASGAVFGQGVRCVAGLLKRLYLKSAVLGSISAPGANDPSVHQASAALGDPIAAGSHRYYGVYYRDPLVLGGCPSTSTFNITQQVDLLWTP